MLPTKNYVQPEVVVNDIQPEVVVTMFTGVGVTKFPGRFAHDQGNPLRYFLAAPLSNDACFFFHYSF